MLSWIFINYYNNIYDHRDNNDLIIDETGPKKIDCGLKDIDANKYKRNYVVNEKISSDGNDSPFSFNWRTTQAQVKSVFQCLKFLSS